MRKFLRNLILAILLTTMIGVVFALVFDHLQDQKVQDQPRTEEEKVVKEEVKPSESPKEQVKIELKEGSLVSVVNKVKNAVVSVLRYNSYQGSDPQLSGSGSGVFYKEDQDYYYLLTNAHVIKDAGEIQIQFADETKVVVELAGSDNDTDLAVLKVKKSAIKNKDQIGIASLGNSDNLAMGETVFAVGNALGMGQSVTKGIISALGRNDSMSAQKSYKLIQTDAAINPGNSGGALFNIEGKLIGINSQKIGGTKVEGVGFAIPINAAFEIATVLGEKGYLPTPYIGVVLEDMNLDALDYYNIPRGVFVNQVLQNGPADLAGIQAKDLILKINDQETLRADQLRGILRTFEPGDKIKLTIFRGDHIEEKELTLVERPAPEPSKPETPSPGSNG